MLALLAARFECHLKRFGLDNQQRVTFVEGYWQRHPGRGIQLGPEIEAPRQSAARNHQLVLRQSLTETLSLAPTKGRHALDCWVDGKGFLVGRPARLKPSLRAEVVGIRIFDRVSEKCPVITWLRQENMIGVVICGHKPVQG